MEQIILTHVGYSFEGFANILSFDMKLVETTVNETFIPKEEFNEDKIPVGAGINSPYFSVENADIDIYKVFQSSINGKIVSAKVFYSSLNI